MAKQGRRRADEDKARKKLATAQLKLHAAEEKHLQARAKGKQEVEQARLRAAQLVAKTGKKVERRAAAVERAEARLHAALGGGTDTGRVTEQRTESKSAVEPAPEEQVSQLAWQESTAPTATGDGTGQPSDLSDVRKQADESVAGDGAQIVDMDSLVRMIDVAYRADASDRALVFNRLDPQAEEVFVFLAESADWERREQAAWLLAELLRSDFSQTYEQAKAWAQHPSQNVRRAVTVAIRRAARERVPGRGDLLLDLLEPLAHDRTEYVRKNVGPFALGDGLLRYYPEETIARAQTWAQSPEEQLRWNVAMLFSSAVAAKHIDSALPILTELATDQRRYVWRAAASALKSLARRKQSDVLPVVETWLLDNARRQAAEVVLSSLGNSAAPSRSPSA